MSLKDITLTHAELNLAAHVVDTHMTQGFTARGAVASAIRAVNSMRNHPAAYRRVDLAQLKQSQRSPHRGAGRFRVADCADCQLDDNTCPGHRI